MSPVETLILFLLIACSAFMSAAEISLFSLSRFQLRSLKEKFRGTHKRVKKLLGDPGGLLITILVTNEVLNISISTLVAGAAATMFPGRGWGAQTLAASLMTVPLVLLLCEATPKVIAARANLAIAVLAAQPLLAVYDAFKPVRRVLQIFVSAASRASGPRGDSRHGGAAPAEGEKQVLLREQEFLTMVEEGHRQGAIHEDELELIKNVFKLDDRNVGQIHTPLSQVYSIPGTTPLRAALQAMRNQRYSRIPVTGENRRRVLGVIYSKDLLFLKLDQEQIQAPVSRLMKKPLVVSPEVRLNVLFRRMKRAHTHLAVVENAAGDAIGIVTMDDILDAVFEDLFEPEEAPEAPAPLKGGAS